jgi:DNA-binding beta-propeller fold protein YncE
MRMDTKHARRIVLALVAVLAMLWWPSIEDREASLSAGSPRLISIEAAPLETATCQWEPDAAGAQEPAMDAATFAAMFGGRTLYASAQGPAGTTEVKRPPVRSIRDTAPSYTAIAVHPPTDEVFLQDVNAWSIRVFNRLDNTPPTAARTEPKRIVMGPDTRMQYNSDIYIDPKNGEIYSIENDTGDSWGVFSLTASGNVAPLRKLKVPHRAFAMAVDEEKGEVYVSVQSVSQVAVFKKTASGEEKPLRVLQGNNTGLESSHGIALDLRGKRMFVSNWGAGSDYNNPGHSRFNPASITVHPLDANGDVPPQKIIRGDKTQLNWPGAIFYDPAADELYVANAMGQSILVFRASDEGDAAPVRVLKGPKTGLSYPVDLAVDLKNKELWAVNFGNASATVYSLTASGDVAPLRTIRSAPRGKRGLKFGKVSTVAYDSKREELLIPN